MSKGNKELNNRELNSLKSEFEELQKELAEYNEKLYDAQIKSQTEENESIQIAIDFLKQIVEERKERLNEVAKKLDYFEGKNHATEPRWGVDLQPQPQKSNIKPPAEVMVDEIEVEFPEIEYADEGEQSKLKNKLIDVTLKFRRVMEDKLKDLSPDSFESVGISRQLIIDNLHKLFTLSSKLVDENFTNGEMGDLEELVNEIDTRIDKIKNVETPQDLVTTAFGFSDNDLNEIKENNKKIKEIIQDSLDEHHPNKSSSKDIPKFEGKSKLNELKEKLFDLDTVSWEGSVDWKEYATDDDDAHIEHLLKNGNWFDAFLLNKAQLWKHNGTPKVRKYAKLRDILEEKFNIPSYARTPGESDSYVDFYNENKERIKKDIEEKRNVLDEIKQAQKLTEESDKIDKEIEETLAKTETKKKSWERKDENAPLKEAINSLTDEISTKRVEKRGLENERGKMSTQERLTHEEKYVKLSDQINGLRTEIKDLESQKERLKKELADILAPPSISLGITKDDIIEDNIKGKTNYEKIHDNYNSRLGGDNKDNTVEEEFSRLERWVGSYNENNETIGKLGVILNSAKHRGNERLATDTERKISVLTTENKQLRSQIERKIKLLTTVEETQGLIEEEKKVDEKLERASEILGNSVYFDDNKNPIYLEPQYGADLDGGKGYGKNEKIYGEPDHVTHKVKGEFFNSKGEQIRSPPSQEIDNSEKELSDERAELFSSLLGIMDMEGEYNDVNSPLVSSMDAFTASRVMSEYNGLMDEITEEIGEAYTELSEAVDEETKELIWNKINGLGELKDELGVLINREIQSPGHMRAVKEAYERAGYQSQVGEGLGQAVHHLDGYNWDIKGRNASSNLILLSKNVHDEFHSIYGKGNNTIEQFFEFLSNYHPEDLGKFIEDYVVPNAGLFGVDEKLLEASKDWDVDTWRKQFNRFHEIPYKRDFNENKDNPLLDYIPYSSFFLNRMEVPVDANGNREITQISTRDKRILDIYDSVSKHERAGYMDMSNKELLNILHGRQQIEVLNGLIEESEMSNLDDFKFYGNGGKEEILKELDKSHERGRKALEGAISGDRQLPFLGVGFDELSENGSLDNTGIGKGLIPVIDRLKEFFEEYKGVLEIEDNPLEKWDSSKGITQENLEILDRLFNDKNGARFLLNHVLASLPVEGMGKIEDIGDPRLQREKIRKFNQEFYDNTDDKRLGAFRDAKNDLAYISGILEAGLSIDTIGQFFSPQGKRKPLNDEFVRYAFGFNPKPETDTSEIDADLADMYEAMGYDVVVSHGKLIVFTKEIQRESEANDYIQGRETNSTTMVDNGSGLTQKEQDELDKLTEQNLSSLNEFIPKSCCDQLLDMMGTINDTVNSVGSAISKALENVGGGFVGSRYVKNKDNYVKNKDKGNGLSDPNKRWSRYDWRVSELKELRDSAEKEENDEIKEFAEKALEVAMDFNKRGLYKSEKNLDLVYGAFGELDIGNLSNEDIGKLFSEKDALVERIRNTITQKERDKLLSENEFARKGIKSSKDLEKEEKLTALEKEKEGLLAKEIISDTEAQYLKFKLEAYKKALYGELNIEEYEDLLSMLIKAVTGTEEVNEKGIRVRIYELTERLNRFGADTSEVIENTIDKIDKTIRYYNNQLKKEKDPHKAVELEEKINALKNLKKEFVEEGEYISAVVDQSGGNLANMPIKGSSGFGTGIYHASLLLETEKNDLMNTITAIESALASGNLSPLRRSALEESLPKYKQEYHDLFVDDSPHTLFEDKMKKAGFDDRVEYLKSLRDSDRVKKELQEENNKIIPDLEKNEIAFAHFATELSKRRADLEEIANASNFNAKLYGNDINALLGNPLSDDSIKKAEELRKASEIPPEKEPLKGRLTTMAYNFRQATQSATQLTGVVTKLFAVVGSGSAVNDMITASSLRQTNEIMLASRRGMEEAEKLYNRIQMLVVQLPGNDTFLTNILTMLGTMDETLTAEDLEYMGGVIADYYMGAQAKGQFNNETERELRNYLMTGQTRNLTNSIIASEVESLKNLNTVKERTMALEKALQKTGMDSIAHYDSYTNTLEEFKGRFQKSFADLGDLYLGFLKGLMDVYNFLDSLTNSFLSQVTIIGLTSVLGALGASVVLAEVVAISASLVEAFTALDKFLSEPKKWEGLAQGYRDAIASIGVYIGVIKEENLAEDINIQSMKDLLGVRFDSIRSLLEEIGARGYAIVLLVQEAIARYNNAFATALENGTLIENTKAIIVNIGARIKSIATKLIDIGLVWLEIGALGALTVVLWGVISVLYILTFLTSPLGITLLTIVGVVWLLVKAFEGLGQAFGWWNDLGEMIEAFNAGVGRVWSAFINSEPVQEMINAFQDFAYTLQALFNWIGKLGGNIWQTIFGVDDGQNGVFDIVGAFLEIVGAIGNIAYVFSPFKALVEILNSIGSTVGWILETWNQFVDTDEFQAVIKGFQDIRKTIGEAWSILTTAFTEVRDAFMSIFEDDGELEETKESMNVLLEILKAIATIINWTIIPLIKLVAGFVKGVAGVVKTVADIFKGFVGLFTNTGDFVSNIVNLVHSLTDFIVTEFLGIPSRILDGIGGGIISAIGLGSNNNLGNQKQLAQNYAYQTSNITHVINNNFEKGSVQADARNMTAKDVQRLFVGAFGYNKARGTQGVLN